MAATRKKKEHAPGTAKPAAPTKSAAAYEAVRAAMAALAPEELVPINIDLPQAISVALGSWPRIQEVRPLIKTALPEHPLATIDKLETYSLAAYHAHVLSLTPEIAASRVGELLDEATPLRANLLSDAEALARRGKLDPQTVADIRAGHGNIDTANDLVALSALFTTNWAEIQDKTAATFEEVQRAGELGPMILAALGARDLSPAERSAAADNRQRAFTLFVRAYDEARRAVVYLRWHEGDADEIAPSLYRGRGGRPAKDEAPQEEAKGQGAKGAEAAKAGDGAAAKEAAPAAKDAAPAAKAGEAQAKAGAGADAKGNGAAAGAPDGGKG